MRDAKKYVYGFFSLASHALRACEARAVRAHKTLTPRVTDFFSDFEEKTDCFAVYRITRRETEVNFLFNFVCYVFISLKLIACRICVFLRVSFRGQNLLKPRPDWSP